MKHLRLLMSIGVVLLSGCSCLDGVHVRVKPEHSAAFTKAMEAFLRSKDFQSHETTSRAIGIFYQLQPDVDGHRPLIAFYRAESEEGPGRFFIGKGNSSKFSQKERQVIAECIDVLVENADAIHSGSASGASSPSAARAKFAAAIK